MNNKTKYLQFCLDHSDIPIFSQPWWLDVLGGKDNWDVILIEKNEKIIASFPFLIKSGRIGLKYMGMPLLTQKLGPYIVYESDNIFESKRIGYEHDIYEEIIKRLPKYDFFNINFDIFYKNWLPFYWNGFKQTTRYTYQIKNIKNIDDVLNKFSKNRKYPVKKAQNNLSLKYDLLPDDFYNYFEEVVDERGEKVSFSRELFTSLYNIVYKYKQGRVFYCVDKDDNIHAINLTIWDTKTAYYLIAMRKKEYNTSGGTEFLVYETIKYVSQFVDVFDFEGSMIKGVEASYRFYGSHQTEYYNITKSNSKKARIIEGMKEIYRGLFR